MFKKTVSVARIVDGDTFICERGKKYRLYLIDAPEHGQPYSKESTKLLSSLILKKKVKIDVKSVDKYKRNVVQCFVGRADVNLLLLKYGLARIDKRFMRSGYNKYVKTEKLARRNKIGVWSNKHITPWDYRAKKKEGRHKAYFIFMPIITILILVAIVYQNLLIFQSPF